MDFYCGIDAGSTATKAVLIDSGKNLLASEILFTGYDVEKTAKSAFESLLKKSGVKEVKKIVSTGYGRMRIPWAHKTFTEITCHAKGAFYLFPGTRTIIYIGGQDSKAIKIDGKGKMVDFAMNDKCSAGTGRFLENISKVLETDTIEMGKLALEAKESVRISSTCTVFAESEVISLIHQGKDRNSIIRGLFEAIVSRVLSLATRIGLEKEVTLTGGVAKNKGVVDAMKRILGFEPNVPEDPQIVGALGAALIALEEEPSKLG